MVPYGALVQLTELNIIPPKIFEGLVCLLSMFWSAGRVGSTEGCNVLG
jgi:hypothetical protein